MYVFSSALVSLSLGHFQRGSFIRRGEAELQGVGLWFCPKSLCLFVCGRDQMQGFIHSRHALFLFLKKLFLFFLLSLFFSQRCGEGYETGLDV